MCHLLRAGLGSHVTKLLVAFNGNKLDEHWLSLAATDTVHAKIMGIINWKRIIYLCLYIYIVIDNLQLEIG